MAFSLKTTKTDRVWRNLRDRIRKLGDFHVKVGVLDSNQPHGLISMAELAAIHEFGAPAANIPERSFIRRTFTEEEGKAELRKITFGLAQNIVNDKMSLTQALEALGVWGANAVRRRVKMGLWPPLRPQTVKRKGSSAPLVDTGQLINSVTHKVAKS